MLASNKKTMMPNANDALPGRDSPMVVPDNHFVSGRSITDNYPAGARRVLFGLGCFWGAERRFWETPGVWVTSVGYAGGLTPNPTYEEVCSGLTGHNEVVQVVYDLQKISFVDLLQVFWEAHDPTQGMRQGNDRGTQYRSGIYIEDTAEQEIAVNFRTSYQKELDAAGYEKITTEILDRPPFYFAEDYHQQYLAKNPGGYCGLGGTGVSCPVGVGVTAD